MNYEIDLRTGNMDRIVYDIGDRFKSRVISDAENEIFTLVSKKKEFITVYILQAPGFEFIPVTRTVLERDFICLEERI